MTISFFVVPQSVREKRHLVGPDSTDTLRGVRYLKAPAVLAAVRAHGHHPVPMWKVLNALALSEKGYGLRPVFRPERRAKRLAYWRAARELIRVKLLFRHRGWLSTKPFAVIPKQRKPRITYLRRPRTRTIIHKTSAKNPGSKGLIAEKITQSADPWLGWVPAVAWLVAKRPRHYLPKFVGKINGEKIRRGSAVRLPSGETRYVQAMVGGEIIVRPHADSAGYFEVFPVAGVVRVKNPAAVLLGGLHRGTRERPSAAKAASARLNGLMPCRPGRHRGRPRKGS